MTQMIQLQGYDVTNKWERNTGLGAFGHMSSLASSLENYGHVGGIKLGRVVCQKKSDFKMICLSLSVTTLQSWTIDKLQLGNLETQAMKFEKGKVIQLTIGHWTPKGDCKSLSPLLDCLRCHRLEEMKIEQVDCWGVGSMDSLTSMLSIPTLHRWTIDKLQLGNLEIQAMTFEKGEVIQLTIGRWTQRDDCTSLSPLLDYLRCHRLEAIKIEQVHCRRGESSLDSFTSLFSIPTLQSWTVDQLIMDGKENPWRQLAKLPGKGSINSLTVMSYDQYVTRRVKEEVNAVKIRIALLHFDCRLHCETDEEVKTLCAALSLAQQWRISWLFLPGNMGAESWEKLGKEAMKGKVGIVNVNKSTLKANNQQVEALWAATDGCWQDYDGTIIPNKGQKRACCQLL